MTAAVLPMKPMKVVEGSWRHTFVTGGVAALAGLMFGLDIGVISGALQFIGDAFHASDIAKEWIVSSMMFGAAAGAIGAGVLSFRLGRKVSLIIGAVLFVVSSLFCAAAWSIEFSHRGPRDSRCGYRHRDLHRPALYFRDRASG